MIREDPYFFENSKYNETVHAYFPDKTNIWVSGIYKKSLVALGVKIYRSELGGNIGHFDRTSWCFLISKEDKEKVESNYE